MSRENIHFVTGRLAEHALRTTLPKLSVDAGFDYSIQVLPITVAALMTPQWIAPRLEIPQAATKILLPGYCDGDLAALQLTTSLPIEIGPKDLRQLPHFFGQKPDNQGYGRWDIEILAEINHAPRLELRTALAMAERMRSAAQI